MCVRRSAMTQARLLLAMAGLGSTPPVTTAAGHPGT